MDAAVDWDDLQESLRKAIEAVRVTPRLAPPAIDLAASALKNARERARRSGGADLAKGLGEVEGACRAAAQHFALAPRYLEQARTRLQALSGAR
jgi:hypothetical protein